MRPRLAKQIQASAMTKAFRFLFEDKKARGFIGHQVIDHCFSLKEAISYFEKRFSNYEIIQVREIAR